MRHTPNKASSESCAAASIPGETKRRFWTVLARLLAPVLLFSGAFAQDAKVIALTSEEHGQAVAMWRAKQEADRAWDKFAASIQDKYAMTDWSQHIPSLRIPVAGFEGGVQFDKDFRFIVPKPFQASGPSLPSSCFLQGVSTLPPVQPEYDWGTTANGGGEPNGSILIDSLKRNK